MTQIKKKGSGTNSITSKMSKDEALADTMANVITKLGTSKAKTPYSKFYAPSLLSFSELTNIYMASGFGKRIVDVYAKAMTREWITIEEDKKGDITDYLDKLNAENRFTSLIKWSRLYGGALMVVFADDGQTLIDPLKLDSIRTIEKLKVYDPTQIIVEAGDYYSDPLNSNFDQVALYTINPVNNASVVNAFKVHESRVIRIDGDELPASLLKDNEGWNSSIFNSIQDELTNFTQSHAYSSEMIHDFVLGVLNIEDLSSLMSVEGGDQAVLRRLDIMAQFRSVVNMVLLGGTESYTKQASSVSGLPELIDRFAEALSAVCGIPLSILFDKWDGGLGDTGSSQMRAWYDQVASEQKTILNSPISQLINIIKHAKDSGANKNQDYRFIFNPLWQRDISTTIADRNVQTQSDDINIQNGVLTPEEVRASRFGAAKYDIETTLDPRSSDIPFSKMNNNVK